jgi:hypothetical protein
MFERKKTNGGGLFARARDRMAAFDDGRVERRILRCTCAVDDKTFDGVFIRPKGEKMFTFKEALLAENGARAGTGASPEKIRFKASAFELSSMTCPHCGASHWIRCGKCDSFVCEGRSEQQEERLFFRCSETCGNEGLTTTLKRVEAYKPAGTLQIAKQSPLLRLRDMR